jgi:small-conductance mechanosensitive channel
MTAPFQQFIESWLFDPTVGKLVSTTTAVLIIIALVRILRSVLNRYVQEPGNLYRAKKLVTFLGYFTGIVIISLVFSDRLGKMAVAFGVAGAGIAFALQESSPASPAGSPSHLGISTTLETVFN